jgi:dienelactone hydrolase
VTFGQTFVLVHGGAHGAWCFERLADRLMRAGHIAVTPNLPGRAGDPTPIDDIALDCYADGCAQSSRRKTGQSFSSGTAALVVSFRTPRNCVPQLSRSSSSWPR